MITIIMPTFNREKTIQRAIQSVINQTYSDWELIIVDDCSTDQTQELVTSIKDDRLQYVRLQQNSGACFARNKGIQIAQGDYITFLDSDNEYVPDKLERQLNRICRTDAGMICCRYQVHCQTGMLRVFPENYYIPAYETKEEIYRWLLVNGEQGWVDTNTMFAKAALIKEIGFDSQMPRWQDYDLALRFSKKYKIEFQDEVLVTNYILDDSISMQSDKLKQAVWLIYQKHQETIESDPTIQKTWHYILAKTEFKSKNCDKTVIKQQY